MGLKQIRIDQTSALLNIQTRRAELNVIRSRRMQLNLRQQAAEMQIQRRMARVQIDQTQCFAEAGLKTALALGDAAAQQSLSRGMEAISSIVSEGLEFLRIERGGNPIKSIAAGRGVRMRTPTVVSMPQSRPQITVDPGSLDITWTPHTVSAEWEMVDGEIEYIPYEIQFSMESTPSIDITLAEGVEFDIPEITGRHVDERK